MAAVGARGRRGAAAGAAVHGLGANTLSWEPAAQLLADDLSTTVTAIDLAGFGRTRATDRPASLRVNTDLVAAVLERLGRATVIGNSMGGVIGVRVTVRTPELVRFARARRPRVAPAAPDARATGCARPGTSR